MVWQSDYSVSSLSEKESRERERESFTKIVNQIIRCRVNDINPIRVNKDFK